MLMLTRKLGEKVIIGANITITVTAVTRGRVQLAFEAPSDVRILRAELAVRHANKPIDSELARSPAECTDAGSQGKFIITR